MKRCTQRTVRINNGRDRPVAVRERGSVTLETALVMPMFLLLVFFLLFLVQTSVIAMSLQGALTQTVRLAASAWYPLSLLDQQDGETSPGGEAEGAGGHAEGADAGGQPGGSQPGGTAEGPEPSSAAEKLSSVRETLGEYGKWLPSPIGDWAAALAEGDWSPEEEAAKIAFGRLAMQLADRNMLEESRFRIVSVSLPGDDAAEAFLTLEAEYRLPFRVPFTGQPLSIRTQVRERVWAGGSPSRAKAADTDNQTLNVKFVSLEPNPVRPGRKATLVLQAEPGAILDLSVIYKSGKSQARNLGTAVADSTGKVSWTWHVSGNTTSGEWHWVVRSEGGSFSQPFQVKRNNE